MKGNLDKAKAALEKLAKDLKNDKLNDGKQKELAEQFKKLNDKLQKLDKDEFRKKLKQGLQGRQNRRGATSAANWSASRTCKI